MEHFGEEIEHLLHFLGSNDLETGIASWHLTNYLVFMFIAVVVMLVVTLVARSKASIIPKGRFYNLIELLVEFVRNDVAVANIGPEGTKYFPFLGTVFFFIAINNIIGTLPGGKPGTGTMGVTVALARHRVPHVQLLRHAEEGRRGLHQGDCASRRSRCSVACHLGHRGHLAVRASLHALDSSLRQHVCRAHRARHLFDSDLHRRSSRSSRASRAQAS